MFNVDSFLRWLRSEAVGIAAPNRAMAVAGLGRRDIAPPTTRELGRRHKRTVLIIDDERRFRSLVFRLLHGLSPNLRVEKAENGLNAQRQIRRFRPDLVVINVVELDAALELCRSIRDNPKTRDARILVISDADRPPTIGRIYDAGADLCLIRPLQFQRFREEVTRLLDHRPH